ncbi:MAG: response regulator [Myxococcales bacterium]|nr:response regulator [Myxococcales bacterium]
MRGHRVGLADVEAALGRGRVLVCDDERRLADLTAALLRQFGFFAESVADGDRAVSAALADPGFDVLILDLNLNGTSSAEVIRRVRELGRGTRIVLTSGFCPEDVPQALMAAPGVVAYLAKPYPVERLVTTVSDALSR